MYHLRCDNMLRSIVLLGLVLLPHSTPASAVPLEERAGGVCNGGIYGELVPYLINFAPAQAFCTAYFPVKCVTVLTKRAATTTTTTTTKATNPTTKPSATTTKAPSTTTTKPPSTTTTKPSSTTTTKPSSTTTTKPSSTTTSSVNPTSSAWSKCQQQPANVISTLCSCIETPTQYNYHHDNHYDDDQTTKHNNDDHNADYNYYHYAHHYHDDYYYHYAHHYYNHYHDAYDYHDYYDNNNDNNYYYDNSKNMILAHTFYRLIINRQPPPPLPQHLHLPQHMVYNAIQQRPMAAVSEVAGALLIVSATPIPTAPAGAPKSKEVARHVPPTRTVQTISSAMPITTSRSVSTRMSVALLTPHRLSGVSLVALDLVGWQGNHELAQ
ncbi:hypothetical protein H2200_002047 [Cladophialophora chaetospira]|uniref:Uncharacterized protein n=1 Tax=Cladophialophora chaetospira TaxID=386627 RepID=A0AA39CLS6_9EURO|nr:hypothetical protein H2200_002047 [Cladophialophora chaetospira]